MKPDMYEPRKIIPPDGWASSARVAEHLRLLAPYEDVLTDIREGAVKEDRSATIVNFTIASAIARRFKMWHLRRNIAEMLVHTDYPEDTTFGEVPVMLHALMLVPPRDLLSLPRVGKVTAWIDWILLTPIGFKRGDKDAGTPAQIAWREEAPDAEPSWSAVYGIANENGKCGPIPMLFGGHEKMSDVDARQEEMLEGNMLACAPRLKDAARVAFGALLLLTNYKDLIYEPPGLPHPKSKMRASVVHSAPAWIGEDDGYRVGARFPTDPDSPSHKKMVHWRRGHWRKQRVGKGRTDNRMVWIRPILINAEVEAKS